MSYMLKKICLMQSPMLLKHCLVTKNYQQKLVNKTHRSSNQGITAFRLQRPTSDSLVSVAMTSRTLFCCLRYLATMTEPDPFKLFVRCVSIFLLQTTFSSSLFCDTDVWVAMEFTVCLLVIWLNLVAVKALMVGSSVSVDEACTMVNIDYTISNSNRGPLKTREGLYAKKNNSSIAYHAE